VAVEGRKLAYTVRLTSYKAVARRRRQSRDRKWRHVTSGDWSDPEVTSFNRKSPGSGCRRPKTCSNCAFEFLQGCSSREEEVTWQEMISRDLRLPKVTWKWRDLTGSHLEVVVEGRNSHPVCLTSYKAVACRKRPSRDKKTRNVTSGDRKLPGSDVILRKSPRSGCRRPKTYVYCAFDFLQGCSSQESAITWQEMTSPTSGNRRWPGSDVICPEVTWKWL